MLEIGSGEHSSRKELNGGKKNTTQKIIHKIILQQDVKKHN